jgi:hypothetical protein
MHNVDREIIPPADVPVIVKQHCPEYDVKEYVSSF